MVAGKAGKHDLPSGTHDFLHLPQLEKVTKIFQQLLATRKITSDKRKQSFKPNFPRKGSASMKWTDWVILCLSRNMLDGLVNTVFLLQ